MIVTGLAPLPCTWRWRWRPAGLVIIAALAATAMLVDAGQAQAPFPTFATQIRPTPPKPAPATGDPQMLVQANEIQYDYPNERVLAVGNVEIYYKGSIVQADKVIYDQRTKHLHAEGNVRLTGADGVITYGDLIDLSDDLRNGFIDSLRLDTAEQTRFAAARATRTEGNFTVLESGVYTACEPCREDPRKPPLWQVKAARIIHDQTEKMIYFEDPRLEFFGVPLAYSPYMAAPDPTVKRKSGFLMPLISMNSIYGLGVDIPYYLALAPTYDMTITPRVMSKIPLSWPSTTGGEQLPQAPLLQTEFRQRLEDGSYTIRAAGLYQTNKEAFANTSGFKDFRGSVELTGRFNLSPRWSWGWDGVLVSDPTFFGDYRIRTLQSRSTELTSFFGATDVGISQLFLTGRGDRSFFDIRALHYTGLTTADQQSVLPNVLPVMDYEYTFKQPVLGGELGYNVNLTSLSRQQASFDPISQYAVNNGLCTTATATADPAITTPANCLLRGVPGVYSRLSAEAHWRWARQCGFAIHRPDQRRRHGEYAVWPVLSPVRHNSFAVRDTTNTGLGSGLDKDVSDYVARFTYAPNKIFSLITRYRFDQQDFSLQRFEVEGRANVDRWSVSLMYGDYAAQPQLGFLERREGLLGQGSVKIDANWSLYGAVRYDIVHNNLSQTQAGISYIDDCFEIGLTYITDFAYTTSIPKSNQTVMLQLGLRTLGSTSSSGFGGAIP